MLIMGRRHRAGDYTGAEVTLMEQLTPRLQRAILLRRCAHQGRALNDLLGETLADYFLLAADRRVLRAKGDLVEELLSRGVLAIEDSALRCGDPSLERRFSGLIECASCPDALAEAVSISYGAGEIELTVIPIDTLTGALFGEGAFLVIVSEKPGATVTERCNRLGLTPREGQLASSLMEGRTLTQTAASLSISPHTARTHLKTVLRKTECHSQVELLAFLSGRVDRSDS